MFWGPTGARQPKTTSDRQRCLRAKKPAIEFDFGKRPYRPSEIKKEPTDVRLACHRDHGRRTFRLLSTLRRKLPMQICNRLSTRGHKFADRPQFPNGRAFVWGGGGRDRTNITHRPRSGS